MSAKTMDDIAQLLKSAKFKKKLFGGLDEKDVWRVLEQMQKEYSSVLDATEQRFGVLLEDRNEMILRQQAQLTSLQKQSRSPERGDGSG